MYDQGKFRGVKSFGEWGDILSGVRRGAGLEVHHIVEKRFADRLGISNTDNMLSIVLTHDEHVRYTNLWKDEIGRLGSNADITTQTATAEQIWAAAQRICADRSDLLEAAYQTIFGGN